MVLPGDQPVKEAGLSDLGNRLGVAKEDQFRIRGRATVMTGLGRAGDSWRPRLTSSFSAVREAVGGPNCCGAACSAGLLLGGARRLFDLEAVRGGRPADPRAEIARGGLQRARQLHDRAQPRLAAGPLEQRDLGAVEIAAIAQLFLGDARGGASATEIGGEPLLRTQVANSSKLKTETLQTRCFGLIALPDTSATFLYGSSSSRQDNYAESVEQQQSMCYTRADNRAVIKEES